MVSGRARKDCEWRAPATSYPCRFHRAGPLAHLILRRARPGEDNATWLHWSSPDLQPLDWKVPAAFFAEPGLFASVFPQLSNRLERVLDQSAPADDDPGFAAHTDT